MVVSCLQFTAEGVNMASFYKIWNVTRQVKKLLPGSLKTLEEIRHLGELYVLSYMCIMEEELRYMHTFSTKKYCRGHIV